MSIATIEEIRARFEALRVELDMTKRPSGSYANLHTSQAWWGFYYGWGAAEKSCLERVKAVTA